MRTAITTACATFTLVFAGCGNRAPEEMLPPACRNFQQAMEDKTVDVGHRFAAAFESLRGVTNLDCRAECYACWVDELCKLDIRNLDYIRQAYCIKEVFDMSLRADGLVDEYHLPDSWMALTIDSMLKVMAWGRKQMDRLKPTMRTGGSYDYGNRDEYSQWKYCYITACGCYIKSMRNIEGTRFDHLCFRRFVSASARADAQKKIEEFLGRKMLNEKESIRAAEEAESALKAVHAREVGPDLKKLRPAEGCQR